MPQKKYIVRLTAQEREICRETIRKLNGSSEKVRRAQMLVKADADGHAWTDQQIRRRPFLAAPRRSRTFANDACWKGSSRRWSENGVSSPRSPNCSTASRRLTSSPCVWGRPRRATRTGRCACWRGGSSSWRSSSRSATKPSRRTLKKRDQRKSGVLGDPAAGRSQVRGADGTGLGSVSETLRSRLSRRLHGRAAGSSWSRKPDRRWRATKNRPRRVDYEYERAGTAADNLFSEPLAGWRQATVTGPAYEVDWALEVASLLEGRYAECPKITLVCDHLNTHTKGAGYEVFEQARARVVRRIEFCHTPETRELAEHLGERTEFDDAPMRAPVSHRQTRDAAR